MWIDKNGNKARQKLPLRDCGHSAAKDMQQLAAKTFCLSDFIKPNSNSQLTGCLKTITQSEGYTGVAGQSFKEGERF
jgi:hypothetical protein